MLGRDHSPGANGREVVGLIHWWQSAEVSVGAFEDAETGHTLKPFVAWEWAGFALFEGSRRTGDLINKR